MEAIQQLTLHRELPHQPDKPALTLQDVCVRYNGSGAEALSQISLRVEKGERIAIVGPNGAGKSTLFNLIVGSLRPTSGEVHLFGHQPSGHICIGYVPQRSQIDWRFPVTVKELVMMGRVGKIGLLRWPRKRDWEMVQHCLERVNAAHLAHKQIGELSGGQQQRVFIARALAQEAEFLLLDEPLTGLDVPNQEAIFTILDSLRPDGVTVLVATHDLNLAAARFDQILLLNHRVIAYGAAATILTTPNLLAAYGGHIHLVHAGDETLVLADTCCEH
ncbi:MAG: metal ABC transporter ATP-binding protein [Anaerolineae bacterium]|nr:metal ABC transporter ATP-binding protein [Anaerolineae bacterium]